MRASNPETIYFAGSGDWTQARLITISGSARTVPMSHIDKPRCSGIVWIWRVLICPVRVLRIRIYGKWEMDGFVGAHSVSHSMLYLLLDVLGLPVAQFSALYQIKVTCMHFFLTKLFQLWADWYTWTESGFDVWRNWRFTRSCHWNHLCMPDCSQTSNPQPTHVQLQVAGNCIYFFHFFFLLFSLSCCLHSGWINDLLRLVFVARMLVVLLSVCIISWRIFSVFSGQVAGRFVERWDRGCRAMPSMPSRLLD